MSSVEIFGLQFRGLTKERLFDFSQHTLNFVVTVNAEFVVEAHRDQRFRELINNNLATFDGQLPYALAKMKMPDAQFEKISGSDLIYDALNYCKRHNRRIFFLGGSDDINRRAVEVAKEQYGVSCRGFAPPYSNYPFSEAINTSIFNELNSFSPDFLFVGFGAKKQEFWIQDHLDALQKAGVKLVVGSGGSFSFLSGAVKRAPIFVQRLGMEGVYRLMQEPKVFRVKRLVKSLGLFAYLFR